MRLLICRCCWGKHCVAHLLLLLLLVVLYGWAGWFAGQILKGPRCLPSSKGKQLQQRWQEQMGQHQQQQQRQRQRRLPGQQQQSKSGLPLAKSGQQQQQQKTMSLTRLLMALSPGQQQMAAYLAAAAADHERAAKLPASPSLTCLKWAQPTTRLWSLCTWCVGAAAVV
jgi:hypothetical protein